MGASPGDQTRKLTVTEPFMTGDDVKAAQRVLHDNRFKINFRPGKVDNQFGPKAADATRLAKFLLGYPEAEVNGEFGPNLYGYLVAKGAPGYKQRPSTFVAPSAARRRLFKPNHSVRERMVSWCLWAVDNTDQIHYEKKRPIPVHDLPGTLPLTTDCSGSTTLFARWAVAPDPNGLAYDGNGSTMTMLAHLKPITADKAQPGDLVVFGGDPGDQHVVVIVEPGEDPTVTSHGSESAPFKLPLSAVADAHTGQPQIYLALM